MGQKTLIIGEIPIPMNFSSISITLLFIFEGKEAKDDLIEVERQQLELKMEQVCNGATIASLEESRPKKVMTHT